jgi:glycosyltransferase involved in cell wall biosynthesis
MPKVSIILPNYNYARYLDERIQSLLNQTYKDFELIILDDASTDNSLEVIQKYTFDPRIKMQFYTENSGLPYKRWNDGSDLAQGEYLLFAGADDSCEPTLIEKLVKKLDDHPSVGLAYSQSWEIDHDANIIGSCKNWTDFLSGGKERWESDFVDDGKNEMKYMFVTITIPNASCLLMRRNIFLKAGKFDTKLILAADWLLYVKILMISDIAFISESLNYFRRHPHTVRSHSSKNGLDIEEEILVKKFILDNSGLTFAPEIVSKAFGITKREWFNYVLGSRDISGIINLKRNIRIFKLLNSVERQLGKQLTEQLFRKIIRGFYHLSFLKFIPARTNELQ